MDRASSERRWRETRTRCGCPMRRPRWAVHAGRGAAGARRLRARRTGGQGHGRARGRRVRRGRGRAERDDRATLGKGQPRPAARAPRDRRGVERTDDRSHTSKLRPWNQRRRGGRASRAAEKRLDREGSATLGGADGIRVRQPVRARMGDRPRAARPRNPATDDGGRGSEGVKSQASRRPPKTVDAVAQSTMRKVSLRLLPFLFVLYIVAYVDRTNVGLAALQMNRDLNLSSAVYGLGAGIFFVGYALFEVPSNQIGRAHV